MERTGGHIPAPIPVWTSLGSVDMKLLLLLVLVLMELMELMEEAAAQQRGETFLVVLQALPQIRV